MPKRTDIHRILVIGSGPIVIGQAAEFDYAGTQACLALREEGYEVILVNSNPATIMTDVDIADKVYMEPLTLEYVAKILRYERPDAIVPGIGGLDRGGANNLICPSAVTSPNCAGEVTSSFLVGVEKVDVFELARQYPEAFGRAFDPATGQVASEFIVEEE